MKHAIKAELFAQSDDLAGDQHQELSTSFIIGKGVNGERTVPLTASQGQTEVSPSLITARKHHTVLVQPVVVSSSQHFIIEVT